MSRARTTMMQPAAYLITWTCYGTWLPGDSRGWVSHHDASPETPIKPERGALRHQATERLRDRPVVLDDEQRRVVEKTIHEVAAHRHWRLVAVNARTNHVHVIVAGDGRPETMMNSFKAWCSRRLNEQLQRRGGPASARWWTRHGSTRYLWDEAAVKAAADYVLHRQ